MGRIISVSRRTDIPAYHTDWFVRRLKEGFVYVRHPFRHTVERVSLRAEDVHSIVFWSKNYSPLISRLNEVEAVTRNLFFHFTITALEEPFEPSSPPKKEAIEDLLYLSRRYSVEQVIWRFDPIVLTAELTPEYYLEKFTLFCERLGGRVIDCYISFVNLYGKVSSRLERMGIKVLEPPLRERLLLTERLATVGSQYGIRVRVCCEPHLSKAFGRAVCIDGERLGRLFGKIPSVRRRPTRRGCNCTESVDIGSYNSCPARCLYCYANGAESRVEKVLATCSPCFNALGFNL